MRIGFALWHLHGYAGTQTWAAALAKALRAKGHIAVFYTEAMSRMGMRLIAEHYPVRQIAHREPPPDADAWIVSQPRIFLRCPACNLTLLSATTPVHAANGKTCPGAGLPALSWLPRGKSVYVAHGVVYPHDAPLINGTPYVAVSEEIAQRLREKTGIEARIIRQPVDLSRFTPGPPLRKSDITVYVLSSMPCERSVVESACARLGMRVLTNPYPGQRWDVENAIAMADIVVGTGRGICEAMASGRVAVVAGKFGCDGVVTPENFERLMQYNFSGRCTKRQDPNALVEALQAYDPALGAWGIETAAKHFDSMLIADQYLEALA